MQLGIPMTTIKGGISAVSKVIFWPNNTMVPKLQITPITTTDKLSKVAESDLKNKNKVIADNNKDPIRNHSISFLILSASIVLI